MMAAATDDDLSFYAEKIRASETVIQKLNKGMTSVDTVMRERASPVRTRRATNLKPTSKSQTAAVPRGKSQAEVELALLLANSPIKDEDRKKFVAAEILRTAPEESAVRGPPAPNVLEPAQTEATPDSPGTSQAKAALARLQANSTIKEDDNAESARAALSRTAPSSSTVRDPPAPNVLGREGVRAEGVQWACATCTYLNNALLPCCELCDATRTTDPPAQAMASPGSPLDMIEFEDAENPRIAPPSPLARRGPALVKALKRPRASSAAGKSRTGSPSLSKVRGTIHAVARSMNPSPASRRPLPPAV